MPGTRSFLPEIHRLRGAAMLGVVLLHASSDALTVDPERAGFPWDWGWALIDTLFHGVTVVFVLVTGLLFMRVHADRPVLAFWRRRLGRIGVPYLFATLIFTPFHLARLGRFAPPPAHLSEFPAACLRNLALGRAQYSYWFVPVLVGLVVLAPVVARLVRSRLGAAVAVAATLGPLVVRRQDIEVTPPTFVYFLCAFVVGAWWGEHYEGVEGWIRRYRALLWALVAGVSAAIMVLYVRGQRPDHPGSAQETLFWFQKLGIAIVLSDVLSRVRRGALDRGLSVVGQHAFPVFLIHAAALSFAVPRVLHHAGGEPGFVATVAIALGVACVTTAGATLATVLLDRMAPGLAGWLLGAGQAVQRTSRAPAVAPDSAAAAS